MKSIAGRETRATGSNAISGYMTSGLKQPDEYYPHLERDLNRPARLDAILEPRK